MPNLWGPSPVRRSEGGHSCVTRTVSRVNREVKTWVDEVGGARSVSGWFAREQTFQARSGRVWSGPEERDQPEVASGSRMGGEKCGQLSIRWDVDGRCSREFTQNDVASPCGMILAEPHSAVVAGMGCVRVPARD